MNTKTIWAESPEEREREFAKMREVSPKWEHFFYVAVEQPNGDEIVFKSCKTLNAAMHLWQSYHKATDKVCAVGSVGI